MFIGENDDESIIEIELRDIDFLEEDFPNRGEVGKVIDLYEIEDLDIGAPISSNENVEEIPQSLEDNGSSLPSSSYIPIGKDPQAELRRSKRESIPNRQFEIEGEAFMIAPQDEAESKTLKKALSSPAAKK